MDEEKQVVKQEDELTTDSSSEESISNDSDVVDEIPQDEENPYKVELEKMEEKVERAQNIAKYEREERKRVQKSGNLSVDQLEEVVSRTIDSKMGTYMSAIEQEKVDSLVRERASDPYEQRLIKHHLEHSIKKSGDIYTDIDNAHVLARRASSRNEIEAEVKESYAKKQAASGGTLPGRPSEVNNKPQFTETESKLIKAVNKEVDRFNRGRGSKVG